MRSLTKIPKVNKEPVPDPSWEVVGHHPDTHRPLYRERIPMTRPVPELDAEGRRVMRVNKLTGEELYPLNKPEWYTLDRVFQLVPDGQANVYKEFYKEPSPEELAEKERRKKVAAMKDTLAEAFVDAGLSPQEIAARLSGAVPTAPEPTVDDDGEIVEYPEPYAPGRWRLSDGTKMQGTREAAEAAEAALAEA